MIETWRTVPSLPHLEASDQGRIRDKERGKILSGTLHGGMLTLWINHKEMKTTRRVKSMVYEAFHGEQPGIYRIAVKNGKELDVRLANLVVVPKRTGTNKTGLASIRERKNSRYEVEQKVWAGVFGGTV